MFDKSKLADVLVRYKKDFLPQRWEREKYKWEAVKCFQDNWDYAVNVPLVEGILPAMRSSNSTAIRKARPNALNTVSA